MNIAIASDHAGFEQKQHLVSYLSSCGYALIDRGPENDERVDYPDFAALVAGDVSAKLADFGILICGTGIGMAIAANKHAGIRAANVIDVEFAKLAREHNDANIICLSARFVTSLENETIVTTFLATPFEGGRHADRVAKIESEPTT